MSKDSWRFDPKRDYCDEYDDFDNRRGNRRNFQSMKKGKKFHKDKFDGKRRNKDIEDRW